MTPAQSAELEQRARELLAREYEREYMRLGADDVRIAERLNLLEDRMAVRAIVAALAAAPAADGVKLGCAGLIAFAVVPPPDGFVLVPREPTPEMVQVGYEALRTNNSRDSSEQGRVKRIYQSMLAALPHMQPAGEAVAYDVAMEGWHSALDAADELCTNARDERYRTRANAVRRWIARARPTPPQPSADPQQETGDDYEARYATAERLAMPPATQPCDFCGARSGDLHSFDCVALDKPQQEAQGAVAWRDPAPHAAAPQPTPSTTLNVTTPPAPVDVRLREIIARKRAEADRDEDAAYELGRFDSERRDDLRRAAKALRADADEINLALLSAQPSADAGDGERLAYVLSRIPVTELEDWLGVSIGDYMEVPTIDEHRAAIDAAIEQGQTP